MKDISWKDISVLVVNNTLVNRIFLKSALELEGANVFTVSKDSDAVKFLKSNINIDLLMVDFNTTKHSYDEFSRLIHLLRPELEAIFCNTYISKDKMFVCENFNNFVISPVPITLLKEKIASFFFRYDEVELISSVLKVV